MNPSTSQRDKIYGIIPVNIIKLSKARLSSILDPEERARLTVAMLKDALNAITNVPIISRVIVVSADRTVRQIAKSYNAIFIWEGERRGLNKGVRLAVSEAERMGASSVLVIHADLPFANSHEISQFLSQCRNDSVGLVPSRDGSGTNALFLRPPHVLPPLFGKNSFQKHRSKAKRMGLDLKVFRSRAIGFDVDNSTDVRRLFHHKLYGETGNYLRLAQHRV